MVAPVQAARSGADLTSSSDWVDCGRDSFGAKLFATHLFGARNGNFRAGDSASKLAACPTWRPGDRKAGRPRKKSPPTAGIFAKSPQVGENPDWMVADAVVVEPVSTPKFPANREKNRDLFNSGAISGSDAPVSPMFLGTYSQIPYSSEQGISEGRTENFQRRSGKFSGCTLGR
jgi:hypothetical protein